MSISRRAFSQTLGAFAAAWGFGVQGVIASTGPSPLKCNLVAGPEIYARNIAHAPYAVKGERVTCVNGHHVCTFAQDVHLGQLQNPPKDFTDWQQTEPQVGTDPLCQECGKRFHVMGFYHVEGSWRDPYHIGQDGSNSYLARLMRGEIDD